MRQIVIERTSQDEHQTTGILRCYGKTLLFECKTLELPYRNNQRNISRIPANHYPAKLHTSPTFGECVLIQDVPDRTDILIHYGNFNRSTKGCVLVGKELIDIDGDGHKDVTASRDTLNRFLTHLEEPLFINIYDVI